MHLRYITPKKYFIALQLLFWPDFGLLMLKYGRETATIAAT